MKQALRPARLAALGFGFQFVWGAILAVSLQARILEVNPSAGVQEYALIAALGATLAALVQIVIGRIADKRGAVLGHRREFYRFGVLAALPLLVCFYVAHSFVQLMTAFFALQIALNIAMGPYQAAIPDYVPPERQGETSSWMSIFQALGAAAGLLVAGCMHTQLFVALALATGLLISFLVTVVHVRGLTIRDAPRAALRLEEPLIRLLIARGLVNVGFYTLLGFLLFYMRDSLGMADPYARRLQTALLFLTFTLTAIIGAIPAGKAADRYDKRLIVCIAGMMVAVALTGLVTAHAVQYAYAALAVAGIGWGAFATADWALACVLLPRGATAAAAGIWNLGSVLPQILAPSLAAPIVLHFSAIDIGLGPRAAIVFAQCMVALGAVCIWWVPANAIKAACAPKI